VVPPRVFVTARVCADRAVLFEGFDRSGALGLSLGAQDSRTTEGPSSRRAGSALPICRFCFPRCQRQKRRRDDAHTFGFEAVVDPSPCEFVAARTARERLRCGRRTREVRATAAVVDCSRCHLAPIAVTWNIDRRPLPHLASGGDVASTNRRTPARTARSGGNGELHRPSALPPKLSVLYTAWRTVSSASAALELSRAVALNPRRRSRPSSHLVCGHPIPHIARQGLGVGDRRDRRVSTMAWDALAAIRRREPRRLTVGHPRLRSASSTSAGTTLAPPCDYHVPPVDLR